MGSIDPFTLRRIPLLDMLEPEQLDALAKHLRSSRFVPGAKICLQGEEAERCYFLLSGQVQVSKQLDDGRSIPLAILREGAIFGQSGMVEGQARTAQVSAIGEVDVLMLERATLDWALNRREAWAVAVQQAIAISLIKQLRTAIERHASLASIEPKARAQLIEGESILHTHQEPVYMNLSGSFTSLPATPPSAATGNQPTPALHQRDQETERLYELLQVTDPKHNKDKES